MSDLNEFFEEQDQEELEKNMNTIDDIFSANGIISHSKKDYIPRESQIEAAKQIISTLQKRNHAILEGPCGFGKTFAYLVPIFIDTIQSKGKHRTIIVTNGIGLQEQLFYKDLPFINQLFYKMYSQNTSFATLKGKGNFICNNKMADLIMMKSVGTIHTAKILKMYNENKIPDGDISSLNFVPDYNTLSEIACVSEGECLGSTCGFYEECHYQKAKSKAMVSQIVVTNYHMLFSDLKTGRKILGGYDNLVFDEAHEIPGIYRDFLEEKISLGTITGIRNKVSEIFNQNDDLKSIFGPRILFDWVLQASETFFDKVQRSMFPNIKKDEIKLLDESIPLCLYPKAQEEFLKVISHMYNGISEILEYSAEKVESIIENYGEKDNIPPELKDQYNSYVSAVNKASLLTEKLMRIKNLVEDYNEIVSNKDWVFWIENKDSQVSIEIKPVSVANQLSSIFFNDPNLSCIITSATLSVNGNFNYIKEQLGLDRIVLDRKGLLEFIGKSPFNLQQQELWYLPDKVIDGDSRNAKAFQELLPTQIIEILSVVKGGALCLFTSYYNLNYAHNEVARKLPYMRILKQGDLPKSKLLEIFKDDADSVLFATKSFFTGVDIPGSSLRCLIIDKFPFPSPGDPVMIKMQKLLANKTFQKVYIPEMVISLKQAVGRGVRTITDKCVIVILDGRMSTARYKGEIFNSFPYEKTGTRELSEIEKFLN